MGWTLAERACLLQDLGDQLHPSITSLKISLTVHHSINWDERTWTTNVEAPLQHLFLSVPYSLDKVFPADRFIICTVGILGIMTLNMKMTLNGKHNFAPVFFIAEVNNCFFTGLFASRPC